LVDLNILDARDETVAGLQFRIRRIATAAPTRHRDALLTYGSWWVIRAAQRRRDRTGRFTTAQVRAAERRVASAADLLSWLDRHHLALAELTQGDLERWIENYPLAWQAADFVRWTRRRGFTDRLTIPRLSTADPQILMSEDDRWRLLARCLHETSLPTDLRVAGALLLLYGLPLSRIVELTVNHLDPRDGAVPRGVRITRTSPVVVVPPVLGRLLSQLPAIPRNRSAVALIEPGRPASWLFPGRSARGVVNASVIARRLKESGIAVRPSRNAALIALAADLPATLLIDLFGLSETAAIQWTRRAGRDWHIYLAATLAAKRSTAELVSR
jgi:hypothetical protein